MATSFIISMIISALNLGIVISVILIVIFYKSDRDLAIEALEDKIWVDNLVSRMKSGTEEGNIIKDYYLFYHAYANHVSEWKVNHLSKRKLDRMWKDYNIKQGNLTYSTPVENIRHSALRQLFLNNVYSDLVSTKTYHSYKEYFKNKLNRSK